MGYNKLKGLLQKGSGSKMQDGLRNCKFLDLLQKMSQQFPVFDFAGLNSYQGSPS